jgi:phosphate acetyltransferase
MDRDVMATIMERARTARCRYVLPEGLEERVIRAAVLAAEQGLGTPLLLAERAAVEAKADEMGLTLRGVEVVDPKSYDKFEEYVDLYVQLRRDRTSCVTPGIARRVLARPVYLGAMMVRMGDADAMVAGAATITATVIRAGELLIGLQEGVTVPSSFFLMDVPGFGPLFFADAAVNPDPAPKELAAIAIATARSFRAVMGGEPRVAMLSFSTKGSAAHPLVEKVVKATELARELAPDLLIDGELQADAALVPAVAAKKLKEPGPVAGQANILIFPDLNSGNIGYKLVQHLAKARAYGPILQGFRRPISDLSRGATPEEIVGVMAILGAMAAGSREVT